ncbi:MFS transporter [Pseudooceanicola aestuarii]|uniref:MFS transporter n=1 Tax=Pseudooceanicola aestuarii TaxID=2697319 RepID=UPI0013D16020|nr:MFS transporter [Pseudooceanicola aestuarii]
MSKRLPMTVILFTVVVESMGIGLIFPVVPDLLREVMGSDLSEAAIWGGILISAFAAMQFLFGPVVGALSDAFGRRPVLLISLAVMVVNYTIMALAGSVWMLLVGRMIGGIAAATHATAMAYIADISRDTEKSANFGLFHAAFGAGFIVGPLLGGLLGDLGTRAPFWVAAAIAACNLVFVAVFLRETVTETLRRPFRWSRANPFGALRNLGRLPGMGALIGVYLLYHVATEVYPVIWAYFTQARFEWDVRLVGVSLAFYGLAHVAVQAGLIRPALRHLGESRTVIAGFAWDIGIYGLLVIITNGALALLLTPLAAVGGVTVPALQGVLSKSVPDNAQGELQGVLSSVTALAMILSPLAYTGVFRAFTADAAPVFLPGAPFALSVLLVIPAILLYLRARPRTAT